MSYDLYMLSPIVGEDPMDTIERLEEDPPEPAAEQGTARRNRGIADELRAFNPAFDELAFQHDEIAAQLEISMEDAQAQFRHIELTDEAGLQVTLSDDHAAITMPYWESLDAKRLADQIAGTSDVIGRATGWRLYDPQLERFIDPREDADAFAEAFGVGVGHVQRIASAQGAPPAGQRPWWRRLLGRG